MIPTKTASQIINELKQYWNAKPFNKAEYLQKEKQKWVAVDVLRQKLKQERKKFVEIEKNTRPELWKEGARWCIKFIDEFLVELEPEEAKQI